MKTYEEYQKAGWSFIEEDDGPLDVLEGLVELLEPHGLTLVICNDACDGFQPFRIEKRDANKARCAEDAADGFGT